jgi:putative endonuclease
MNHVRTRVASWQKPKASGVADASVGQRGERLAAEFLKKIGYRILFQGYRSSLGELDIIALDETHRGRSTVVFVEVKTWTKPFREGGPADAVDQRKQQKLTRLALEFLKTHGLMESQARFDVVEVILEPQTIRHFVNAFEATGKNQWFS